MQQALKLHEIGQTTVIPIILRPVDWANAPFGNLQALPKDAKPVTTWQNIDEAFSDVAKGIRNAVMALQKSKHANYPSPSTTRFAPGGLPRTSATANHGGVQISLLAGDVLSFASDVLILKYAQAFHGIDRVVAQRLARPAEDLASFQIPLGEYRLIDTLNAIGSKKVLFMGVQPLVYLDYAAIERFAESSLLALRKEKSSVRRVSLTWHGPGYGLDEREALFAVVRGVVSGIAKGNCPQELEHVALVERSREPRGAPFTACPKTILRYFSATAAN